MNSKKGKGYGKGDNSRKKSNINVAIKVRPLIDKETSKREFSIVKAESNLIVNLTRSSSTPSTSSTKNASKPNWTFTTGNHSSRPRPKPIVSPGNAAFGRTRHLL